MENFIEQRLAQAAADGEFSDLPGSGQPIPNLDRPYDPNWWARTMIDKIKNEDERRATIIRLEKQLASVWTLGSESAVRHRVAELNTDIDIFDADAVVASWRQFRRSMRDRS